MIFHCRAIVPDVSPWHEVESQSTEDAVQDLDMSMYTSSLNVIIPDYSNPEKRITVSFRLFEIEGHGKLISRIFNEGIIYRLGGHYSWQGKLINIAKELEWTEDPKKLIDENW